MIHARLHVVFALLQQRLTATHATFDHTERKATKQKCVTESKTTYGGWNGQIEYVNVKWKTMETRALEGCARSVHMYQGSVRVTLDTGDGRGTGGRQISADQLDAKYLL